jgi:hypothetical protein
MGTFFTGDFTNESLNAIRLILLHQVETNSGHNFGTSVSFFDLKLNQILFGLVLNLKKQSGLFLV